MAEKTGVGERMRKARLDLGLSGVAMAARMDVSRATLAAWEEERTSPDVADVARLSKALCVSPSWLVFGREKGRAA